MGCRFWKNNCWAFYSCFWFSDRKKHLIFVWKPFLRIQENEVWKFLKKYCRRKWIFCAVLEVTVSILIVIKYRCVACYRRRRRNRWAEFKYRLRTLAKCRNPFIVSQLWIKYQRKLNSSALDGKESRKRRSLYSKSWRRKKKSTTTNGGGGAVKLFGRYV